MREQVELLEDHADVGAQAGQVDARPRDRLAEDDDVPLLHALERVDAADQGALAGARGPTDHDDLAAVHREGDVAQDVELSEPLVDGLELDHRFGHGLIRRGMAPSGERSIEAPGGKTV